MTLSYSSLGPPIKPTIIRIDGKGHDSATVFWSEGFHGGFNQSIYIEIITDSSNVSKLLQHLSTRDTPTTRNSTIIGLEGATTYYVRLFANNERGVSEMSDVWNFTTAGKRFFLLFVCNLTLHPFMVEMRFTSKGSNLLT